MSRIKKFRYIGDATLGERAPFVTGVPSRDLYDDDDADALKLAEANSQTDNPVFVAVKHTSTPFDSAQGKSLSASREEPVRKAKAEVE